MKSILSLLLCILFLVGCGGSGTSPATRSIAGNYEGVWVNIEDPLDKGRSDWLFREDRSVAGNDIDDTKEFAYVVEGSIDAAGNFVGETRRIGFEEVVPLAGRLEMDSQGHLVGNLVWSDTTPLTYTYTFTRVSP